MGKGERREEEGAVGGEQFLLVISMSARGRLIKVR